jgi:hypothetical protein
MTTRAGLVRGGLTPKQRGFAHDECVTLRLYGRALQHYEHCAATYNNACGIDQRKRWAKLERASLAELADLEQEYPTLCGITLAALYGVPEVIGRVCQELWQRGWVEHPPTAWDDWRVGWLRQRGLSEQDIHHLCLALDRWLRQDGDDVLGDRTNGGPERCFQLLRVARWVRREVDNGEPVTVDTAGRTLPLESLADNDDGSEVARGVDGETVVRRPRRRRKVSKSTSGIRL